jgi:hypothetical protein
MRYTYGLHPEFEGENVDQRFEEAIDRLWPEHANSPRNFNVACPLFYPAHALFLGKARVKL